MIDIRHHPITPDHSTDIVEAIRAVAQGIRELGGAPISAIYIDQAAAEIERLRRELNLLRAVHENAEAEVRQLLDENGPLIAVCREFIDRWPTEQGIDNTIQRARAILLDHDLRSPPGHAVNRALEAK